MPSKFKAGECLNFINANKGQFLVLSTNAESVSGVQVLQRNGVTSFGEFCHDMPAELFTRAGVEVSPELISKLEGLL